MEQYEELRGANEALTAELQELMTQLDPEQEVDLDLKALVPKVKELLHNYAEDKRTLRQLMEERESERDTLADERDQIYQEKESIMIEKSKLQDKLQGSNVGQLEKKVRILEEESSMIRSEYQIQIRSFVDEIDTLKSKLSRKSHLSFNFLGYEESQADITHEEQKTTSFNETLPDHHEGNPLPNFADSSHISGAADQSNIQQRSGLFNSLAYFFLTESQIHKGGGGGAQTNQ